MPFLCMKYLVFYLKPAIAQLHIYKYWFLVISLIYLCGIGRIWILVKFPYYVSQPCTAHSLEVINLKVKREVIKAKGIKWDKNRLTK